MESLFDYGVEGMPAGRVFDDNRNDIIRRALEGGYTGIDFKQIDPADGYVDGIVAIFDPKNIRSVNAAFDPSQTQSPNLMASRSDDTQSDMFDPYADPDVYVNLARIEGPEDFRALVQKLANESRNEVKQRVGPKQTLGASRTCSCAAKCICGYYETEKGIHPRIG